MKYYIISGEASGDLHGSNLIKEICKLDNNSDIRAWGGDLMREAGADIVKHYKELAFMGFKEVAQNINTIRKNFNFCYQDITDFKPDILILIDYPGFNLRVAKFAKNKGFKVVYYISPQIWAWKQSRVHKIKSYVDKMLVILPFEKEFYAKFNYEVSFVGHPLLDAISIKEEEKGNTFIKDNNLDNKPIIAVLPGSRKQEIKQKLPVMLSVIDHFPEYQFVIGAASSIEDNFLDLYCKSHSNVKRVKSQTYDLLMNSKAAMVTSGTATLETALFEVPEVVCYKSGFISYYLAKKLIKVKYISLVNLIMEKEVVKELIQFKFNKEELTKELKLLLYNNDYRNNMLNQYKLLKEKLGGKGASERAAREITEFIG